MKYKIPFIEPIIRTVVGFLMVIIIGSYLTGFQGKIVLFILLILGLNLFQSGITGFCGLEKLLHIFGFKSEIDEIKKLNKLYKEAAEAQLTYASTLNLLDKVMIELGSGFIILNATENWDILTNLNLDTVLKENKTRFPDFIHPEDRGKLEKELVKLFNSAPKTIFNVRFKLLNNINNKGDIWLEGKFCLIETDNGNVIRAILNDITENHLKEQNIAHLALHDPLTDLPNRIFLKEKMQIAKSFADRNNKRIACLFIDLDNFKKINDTFGHQIGDELILRISQLLNDNKRTHDTLIRWGGDEFILIASDLKNTADASIISQKIINNVKVDLENSKFAEVSLSIGIAVYPDHADNMDKLIERADDALLFCKSHGKNNYYYC